MKKSLLNYTISTQDGIKVLSLEKASLYYIDRYTSQYRNDDDLLCNYPMKDTVYNFVKSNGGIKGKFGITYPISVTRKEEIPLLYDHPEPLIVEDSLDENIVTEVEHARKLLFNSRGQIFARLLLSCKSISDCYDYKISITYDEYVAALKKGVPIKEFEGKYYIEFKELLKYRASNTKLGALRDLFSDSLDMWEQHMMQLNPDDLYYYSRQFRILIKKYEEIKLKRLSISNLRMFKFKDKSFEKGYVMRYRLGNTWLLGKIKHGKKKILDAA